MTGERAAPATAPSGVVSADGCPRSPSCSQGSPSPPRRSGRRRGLFAALVRAVVPIEQTMLLVALALAACMLVGWWAGARILLPVVWLGLAGWVLTQPLPTARRVRGPRAWLGRWCSPGRSAGERRRAGAALPSTRARGDRPDRGRDARGSARRWTRSARTRHRDGGGVRAARRALARGLAGGARGGAGVPSALPDGATDGGTAVGRAARWPRERRRWQRSSRRCAECGSPRASARGPRVARRAGAGLGALSPVESDAHRSAARALRAFRFNDQLIWGWSSVGSWCSCRRSSRFAG
jgi:hypothetical protein